MLLLLRLHDDGQGREAGREAVQAIKASGSSHLESTTVEDTPSARSDVEVQPAGLQDPSHGVFASGKHLGPCVTTAHDTTKDLAVNGKGEPTQGMTLPMSSLECSQELRVLYMTEQQQTDINGP